MKLKKAMLILLMMKLTNSYSSNLTWDKLSSDPPTDKPSRFYVETGKNNGWHCSNTYRQKQILSKLKSQKIIIKEECAEIEKLAEKKLTEKFSLKDFAFKLGGYTVAIGSGFIIGYIIGRSKN